MLSVPDDLLQRLRQHGQEHVLAWWQELTETRKKQLLEQLRALDLEQLQRLYAARDETFTMPPVEAIAPVPIAKLDPHDRDLRRGEEALRRGEVAALIVAGGQDSRLGFEHPKGMFAIGPVSDKSLFQIHAEKVLALGRRYGKSVPFLIMTSPTNHAETEAFFKEHR